MYSKEVMEWAKKMVKEYGKDILYASHKIVNNICAYYADNYCDYNCNGCPFADWENYEAFKKQLEDEQDDN